MKQFVDYTELDFAGIKQSLKTFLQGQQTFADFNFEGSNINILLDIMAANTHYYAVLSNMLGNEMFLDSAVLRSSVVSIAKELGYTPKTARAARAIVNLTIKLSSSIQTSIELPRGTKFTSSINGAIIDFVLANNITLPRVTIEGQYYYQLANVELFQGKFKTATYYVDLLNKEQKFIIPTSLMDSNSLQVRVYDGNAYAEFYQASKVLTITDTTNIFFLKETDLGQYELKFGDGIIGTPLQQGQTLVINYLTTTPFLSEGTVDFTLTSIPANGVGSVLMESILQTEIITTSAADGSAYPESTEEIKDSARKFNAAQYRSVVAEDYKTNILATNNDIIDVNSWGGEDNIPAYYGRVMLSCLNSNLDGISASKQAEITQQIKQNGMIGIIPTFVQPSKMTISLAGFIRYDKNQLDIQSSQLLSNVSNYIINFDYQTLRKYNKQFSYSKFVAGVDSIHTAITSSVFELYMTQKIVSTEAVKTSHLLGFNNQILPYSVRSEAYVLIGTPENVVYFALDDGQGRIWSYKVTNGDFENRQKISQIGTVNYSSGIVQLINFAGQSKVQAPYLDISAQPQFNEIVSRFNQVLLIDNSKTLLEAIAD